MFGYKAIFKSFTLKQFLGKTNKDNKFDTNTTKINEVDFHVSSNIKDDTTIRLISNDHLHLFSKYNEPVEEKLAPEVNEKFVADNVKFSINNADFTQTEDEGLAIPYPNITIDSKFEVSLHLNNQNPINFTNNEVELSPLFEESSYLNGLEDQSSCTNNDTEKHNIKADMQSHNNSNEYSSCSYTLPNISHGQCEELKADHAEDVDLEKTSLAIFSKQDEQIASKDYQIVFDPINEIVFNENSVLLLKNSTQNTEIDGQYSELSIKNLFQKPEVKNAHEKSDFTKVTAFTNNSGHVKCPVTQPNTREGYDCSNLSLVASEENEFVEDPEVNAVFKNTSGYDVKFGESVSCTSTSHEILDLPTKSPNFENSGSDLFFDIDNSIYIEQSSFFQDLSENRISLTKDSLEEFVNTSVSESPLQEFSASQVLPTVLSSNAMITVNFPLSGTLPGGLISDTQLEKKFNQVRSVLFENKIKDRVNFDQNIQELSTIIKEEQSSQLFEQLNQNLNDPLKSSPKPFTRSAQIKRTSKSKNKSIKLQFESSNFELETNNSQNGIIEELILSNPNDINTESGIQIKIGASNKVLPTTRSTRAKKIHNEIISRDAKNKSVVVNQTKGDQLEEKNVEVVETFLSDSIDMASKKPLKEGSVNKSEALIKKLDLPKRVAKQIAERKIIDLKLSKKLKNEKDVDKSETTKCANGIYDTNITWPSKNSEHSIESESVEICPKKYSTRAKNALNDKTASDAININRQSVVDQDKKQVVELKDETFPLTHPTHSEKSKSVIHPISDDQLTAAQFSDGFMNEKNFDSFISPSLNCADLIKNRKVENQVINFANQSEQPQALTTNTHNIIKRSARSKQSSNCNSDRVTEKEIPSSKEMVHNVVFDVINPAKCSRLIKDTTNAQNKSTTVFDGEKSALVRSTRSSKLKERETLSQIEVLEQTANNENYSTRVKHLMNLENVQTNVNDNVITCPTTVRRSTRSRKAEPAIEDNLNSGNEKYLSETASRHNKEIMFDKNLSPTKKTKLSKEKTNDCSRSPKSCGFSGVKFLLGNVNLPTRRSTRRKRVCDVNSNKKSKSQKQSVQSGFLMNNDPDRNDKPLDSNLNQSNNTEIIVQTTNSPNKMEKTSFDRSTQARKAEKTIRIHETVCESNHNNNTNADVVVTSSPRNLRRRKKNKDSDGPLIETGKKHRCSTKDEPECLDFEETKVPLISRNLVYELQLTDQSGLALVNVLFASSIYSSSLII